MLPAPVIISSSGARAAKSGVRRQVSRLASGCGAGLLLALLAGCAGYQLGPTNGLDAGSRTVRVAYFENQTQQPRLSEEVAHAMRKQFQQDGTYRLATSGEPDVMVTGRLVRFERNAVSYSPRDTRTTRDEEIRLHAHVIARDTRTGRNLVDREVLGRVTVRLQGNQTSAERQALPLLAADLATKAVPLIVDGEW